MKEDAVILETAFCDTDSDGTSPDKDAIEAQEDTLELETLLEPSAPLLGRCRVRLEGWNGPLSAL